MFSLAEFLQTLDYFQPLDHAARTALAQHAQRKTYTPGALIFLEGEPASGLWIVD